jgi:hypothetical protein
MAKLNSKKWKKSLFYEEKSFGRIDSRGRIFSQFENELVPSWERGIWEKH